MIRKQLDDIAESDLRELIENSVPEGKTIEYKKQFPDPSDQGKVKFLRSVTAFANTTGGDLIFGMEAKDGVPIALVGLPDGTQDARLQWCENICRDCVEPRLPGVRYRAISVSGGYVLIARVQSRSWAAPHRVVLGNHSQFYGRNSAGTYQLDVGELRQAFTASSVAADRIRAFRADRLMLIGSEETPVRLQQGAVGVLHVIPLQAFTSDAQVDVLGGFQAPSTMFPPGSRSFNVRLNLEGKLTLRTDGANNCYGYAQLFRSGIVEATQVYATWREAKTIASFDYEKNMLDSLASCLVNLQRLGVSPPIYVFFALAKVAGWQLGVDPNRFIDAGYKSDRDLMIFPEVTVEDWSQTAQSVMRPIFDMVWNAFGFERSYNYNDKGGWIENG